MVFTLPWVVPVTMGIGALTAPLWTVTGWKAFFGFTTLFGLSVGIPMLINPRKTADTITSGQKLPSTEKIDRSVGIIATVSSVLYLYIGLTAPYAPKWSISWCIAVYAILGKCGVCLPFIRDAFRCRLVSPNFFTVVGGDVLLAIIIAYYLTSVAGKVTH
jgi:hypothetical protein